SAADRRADDHRWRGVRGSLARPDRGGDRYAPRPGHRPRTPAPKQAGHRTSEGRSGCTPAAKNTETAGLTSAASERPTAGTEANSGVPWQEVADGCAESSVGWPSQS